MPSGNPALNEQVFSEVANTSPGSTELMTLDGTVAKASILTLLVIGGAAYTWNLYATQSVAAVTPWIWIGSIAGFVVAMVTIFKKTISPYTAPLYAVLEGLVLGGLSAIFEAQYPGVVVQAISLTFAILAAMLIIYATGLIKPSENFKLGVAAATGGICIYYLIAIVLSFFHIRAPMIWDSGPIGIGFSVFVVIIASLNLVIDFDFIEQGIQEKCPKYMEWYGAFGLMVTLVWLYLEVLRLLSKMRRK